MDNELPQSFCGIVELRPRILMVDDDPVFGRLMQVKASELGISLLYLSSPRSFRYGKVPAHDLVILDWDLETVSGTQLIRNYFRDTPVLLVSTYKGVREVAADSPHYKNVIFCHKGMGPDQILTSALRYFERFLEKSRPDNFRENSL